MRTDSYSEHEVSGRERRWSMIRGSGALLVALLALSWAPLRAATAGALSGTVSNPAGTAVPGVKVLLMNTATKDILTAVTNEKGGYTFPALPEGTYELRVEQRTFLPYAQDGLIVAAGATLKIDIHLKADPEAADAAGAPDSHSSAPPKPYSAPLLTTKGGFLTGISRRDTLFGDTWGVRRALSRFGISLNVLETSEELGNLSGGIKRGAAYDGLTQVFLQLDTQRAFHWYGGTFNVSALQIHGQNLSENVLYNLQTASGIQANRATRLWELWYDQKFGETNAFDVKIGQQSLDQEFMVSQNALVFVNTMMGWAMLPSADMPGGGPAYPLSALGVRARARVTNAWTVLAGVYNGKPWSGFGDAQDENSSGTSFPLNGGALAIAEVQYAYPSLGTMVRGNHKTPLPRIYRFGVWHDTTSFDDMRMDNSGLSLANPASTGVARTHKGDTAFYAVADQMIWQHEDEADRNMNVFVRAMGTPLTDRNLIDFSVNAGLTFNEPIWHRDDDVFGIGMGYTHVSSRAAGLDRDTRIYGDPLYPIRGGETFIEATYRYQFKTWWQWQPTFQYVFNPGAGIVNPNSPAGNRIKGEAIIGLRMNFAF